MFVSTRLLKVANSRSLRLLILSRHCNRVHKPLPSLPVHPSKTTLPEKWLRLRLPENGQESSSDCKVDLMRRVGQPSPSCSVCVILLPVETLGRKQNPTDSLCRKHLH